jgi:hypothetical protein
VNLNLYRARLQSSSVKIHSSLVILSALSVFSLPGHAQTDVDTWHNDVARSGLNQNESLLTPARVNSTNFGLLIKIPVDGKVDAQPLYLSALNVGGQVSHNVVLIATEHGTVYAVDADTGKHYWHTSVLGAGETTSDDRNCGQVAPEIGITATPVVDRSAGAHGTVFLAAMSKDGAGNYYQRIHALDLYSGAEQPGSPVLVQATYPGTGDNSSNGVVVFDAKQYKDRPALLLLNGTIYTSWGSHCDIQPYTGWMMAYNESSLKQTAVLNFAPNGQAAALWNAGAGPAADSSGNIYVALGNGTFDTVLTAQGLPSQGDYGNAMVKVQTPNLAVLDYWTMYNSVLESSEDKDLGAGGLMVLPNQTDSTGKVRHLAAAAGKDGNLYLADLDNMGHYDSANDGTIYQQLSAALPGGMWSSPAYFNGRVYYGPVGSNMRSFEIASARVNANSVQTTPTVFGYPGTTPSISAYGPNNGIVWATENTNPVVLHAYDANNLNTELYNSNQAAGSRDHFGAANKYIVPTIANGKVFVGTTNSVAVFGYLPQTPAPVADGIYRLMNDNSRLVLENPGFSTTSGTVMYQAADTGNSDQRWFLSYNGLGYYTIQSVTSRFFLTDPKSSATAGISLEQAAPTNDDSQLWSLIPIGHSFIIQNKATGLVFDDQGSTTAAGPFIDLAAETETPNQSWYLE